jgi:hypothetical protein
MADTRSQLTWGTHLRFLVRFLGLTGVLAGAVGAILFASEFPDPSQWTVEHLRTTAEGGHGRFAQAAAWTLIVGVAAVASALGVELLAAVLTVAGRRTSANASATLGTAAALALLVFVNAYSFTHHARFDLTRDRRFTLPDELAERLRGLRPEVPTSIIVLQKHRLFGTLSEERDSFTKAAEEKVTEKVKDLVDLFREFGPRFTVEVLDTEAFEYDRRLAEVTRDSPRLRAAIEAAPENSIFFAADGRVQRLGFNEFLQLDRTASRDANGGRGNLVLLPQGVENFARRVLAVQERRPKAAVCVVHPVLGTEPDEARATLGTAGLKKALNDAGYDVIDIVLKANWESESKPLVASALTGRESKLEQLEAELDAADDRARAAREDLGIIVEETARLARTLGRPFPEQVKYYQELFRVAAQEQWLEVLLAYQRFELGRRVNPDTEPDFRKAVADALATQRKRAEEAVEKTAEEQAAAEARVRAALADEQATEDRREADVKDKFRRLLDDVDVLIVPRITLVNATTPVRIADPRVHSLSKDQAEVIKEFMKAGKPVLACLGSLSGPNGLTPNASDDFERLLAERGIELGNDTIIFDAEARAFAGRGVRFGGAAGADVPPLVVGTSPRESGKRPNPIGDAFRLTGRVVDQKLDLQFRALRPVYLSPAVEPQLAFAGEFVFTAREAWNEEKPFALADPAGNISYRPRFERTAGSDPKKGTRDEERQGPFPVGVAIASAPPAYWSDPRLPDPARLAALFASGTRYEPLVAAALAVEATRPAGRPGRLVVFGSGHLFAGPKLEPAQEKLLVHSVNWLTQREDRLPKAELPAWSFPRVALSDRDVFLWRYGATVGLPLVVVYLGLVTLTLRRLR